MPVKVCYATEETPTTMRASIFLAGPSPRDFDAARWREDAKALFDELWPDSDDTCVLFEPIPRKPDWGSPGFNFDNQVGWEVKHLDLADCVFFWVPRDVKGNLPAFTTNVEFGLYARSGKAIFGAPPTAEKNGYLKWWADKEGFGCHPTLRETVQAAIDFVKFHGCDRPTALRRGGDVSVPLPSWHTSTFQRWHEAQVKCGNTLLPGTKVVWTFCVKKRVFFQAVHVRVAIASESGRVKDNEVVICRPDVAAVVAFQFPLSHSDAASATAVRENTWLDTKVLLVREFRSPGCNADAMVEEIPGGSTWAALDDPDFGKQQISDNGPTQAAGAAPGAIGNGALDVWRGVASEELEEEAGLAHIDPSRVVAVGSRQIAATMSAHKAHIFRVELSAAEFAKCEQAAADKTEFGVAEDTERTWVACKTVRKVMAGESCDWATVGMITKAVSDAWAERK